MPALGSDQEFFVDPQRCIGCHACELGCAECETNGQLPMITVEYVERAASPQTGVQLCMHCEQPTCARVCPADAITKDELGVVHSANPARCIACASCVLACPFGVPKRFPPEAPAQTAAGAPLAPGPAGTFSLMVKCNNCYDRTTVGLRPMCATVCPSGALWYGPRERMARQRPGSAPVSTFRFGQQVVQTRLCVMMPRGATELVVD
jgi:Fe-S-cluster-containing dehydrogenase component